MHQLGQIGPQNVGALKTEHEREALRLLGGLDVGGIAHDRQQAGVAFHLAHPERDMGRSLLEGRAIDSEVDGGDAAVVNVRALVVQKALILRRPGDVERLRAGQAIDGDGPLIEIVDVCRDCWLSIEAAAGKGSRTAE